MENYETNKMNIKKNGKVVNYDVDQKDAILSAVSIIKDTCIEQETCESCPFYYPMECICCITNSHPRDWADYEDYNYWRALTT